MLRQTWGGTSQHTKRPGNAMKYLACTALIVCLPALASCSELRYYLHSAKGHLGILNSAMRIDQLIAEEKLDSELRATLELTLTARHFAEHELKLPVADNYSKFTQLERDYAVWNLTAAQEFSTQLYEWCYPVIGCASYRGYFDEHMLREDRKRLREKGYDTYAYGVTAYSTLGWFDDPVLSTFVHLPRYQLVGLLFHELAHQQVFIADDTIFNESFATAVESAGLTRFYTSSDNAAPLQAYRAHQERQITLMNIAMAARQALEILYQQPIADDKKRQRKQAIFAQLERQYAAQIHSWNRSESGHDHDTPKLNTDHFGEFNNARLGLMVAYNKYVPAFLNLLRAHQDDFTAFYAHVEKLGKLKPAQREQCLLYWSGSSGPEDTGLDGPSAKRSATPHPLSTTGVAPTPCQA